MSVPMPKTPGDIITLALKTANVVGVGQTAAPEDMNDSFNLLNMLLAQLQRRRYFVYQLVTTSKQATGAQSYTVGPGGDFNIPRPAKIESAFFRLLTTGPQPVDYPLEILRSQEDYNRIGLKSLNAFPRYAFYDMGYPLGNLYVWPIPNNTYTIFITTMLQLQQFNTINDTIALPPEYAAALMWNLVPELYAFYGLPPNPDVVKKAEATLRIIEEANAAIPQLSMPAALRSPGVGWYNIYGDYMVGTTP
ncbi:hypothetical protein C7410_115178 [Paraburkholderia silvatlantica]|uniref:Uncharacterized protein n=1 Tax=Paraburkholderia silvatlantica TaxID=321895 RepID=A0A2V4T717_9BURK|nr:hypothetical protein [Paraburkholderia silvatlantica]PYE21335.1 hypothetical protein C7410_115178 [Paraburkholderia silvatlantica]